MGTVPTGLALMTRAGVLAVVTAALATVGFLVPWLTPVRAPELSAAAVDTTPATRALEAVRQAWVDELDELSASVRALAFADDTYEFVSRPNIPYVRETYTRERLAAERIDTVLIIDRQGKPLFWRRVNDRQNRGFLDAEVFLAELPRLLLPGVPNVQGNPALAGAARLARGPSLVVAMPIYPASRMGPARGWLIAGRTLDAAQWRRYGERAQVDVDALDPHSSDWPPNAAPSPARPLMPVIQVEPTRIRGLLPVYDIKGQRLRLFSIAIVRPAAPVTPIAPSVARDQPVWPWLVPLLAALVGVLLLRIRRRRGAFRIGLRVLQPAATARQIAAANTPAPTPMIEAPVPAWSATMASAAAPALARPGVPGSDTAIDTLDLALPMPPTGAKQAPAGSARAPAPALPATPAGHTAPAAAQGRAARWQRRLRERFAAATCGVLYQPQVDLHSDRIEGVEAILCIAEDGAQRPVSEVLEEEEAADLELEVTAWLLREAWRDRQEWLRKVCREFAVSVPVSRYALADPRFLPVLRRILEEGAIAPHHLELAVMEATITDSAAARRALAQAHRAGVSICVNGFGKGPSSLRLLASLPVSKIRMDATLVRRAAHDPIAAALVHAIVRAARALRITVCATGVDSSEQLAALAPYGRLLAQGVALSPPMDGERLLAALRGSDEDTARLPILVLDEPARDEFVLVECT